MADIELVIKIPKGLKNDFESEQWTALSCMEMKNALERATPLSKGHGRLIDADELKTLCYEVLLDSDNPNRADGLSSANGIVEEDIDLAPTIIEADKESEDKACAPQKVCMEDSNTVIEKIKKEIENLRTYDKYTGESYLACEYKEVVLYIIDKHKAESEEV